MTIKKRVEEVCPVNGNMNYILVLCVCFLEPGLVEAGGFISSKGQVHISKKDQDKAVTEEKFACYEKIFLEPYRPGLYCNRTFDEISCWPDTQPGVTQYLPCPNYIHGFFTVGNATRKCLPNGEWYVSPDTNSTWTNYSQCLGPRPSPAPVSQLITVHVEYIQLVYNTGYGISLVSLLLAVFIMLKFRKLHCPRNTVHVNLFISFILRAIVSFLKDILMVQGLGFSFDVEKTPTDTVLFIEDKSHWECKLLYTMFHYILSANYMWILVEGLYLHTLVNVSVFSERSSVRWYYALGWGTPFLSVLPWVAVKIYYENVLCWNTNPTAGFFWILRAPIVISLLINFFFFINILRALFTRLRKPNSASARRNRYRRLAKATLILIPLFGVHYIAFIGISDNVGPTAEVVKLYIEMFLNSIQGFVVAVLFCFLNREVQMELRKTWYRLWSKPDPVYLQQSQYLQDSVNNANGVSRRVRPDSRSLDNQGSSEGSGDMSACLCKWTLDKNGKLRRSFIKSQSLKSNKSLIIKRETKM